MRIVVNEQLKDAIEWTCKYASEYKVDIDIHIDADGEISVSVCPTYRDTADTPQTEQMKTADYCDICKQDMCKDCIADATNPYCVPSHYEINYEPKDEPTTQTETQNSNLTFEKRTMLDCYNCKRYKNDDACVECRYEPKDDTPQTEPSEEEIREAIIDGCKRSAKFSKVISTSQTEQTDCDTCKYAQIADEHCEFCGEAYIDNYEPQTESYYTDATHFGKAKGESTTTNTADTPQTEDEIVLDPSFAELSVEQFVKAMKLIEPQTDCGWK